MARVLAGRRRSVMAGGTTRSDTRVIELCSGETHRAGMAGFARCGRRYMARIFSSRCRSVMAARTAIRNSSVVECGSSETHRTLVTGLTRCRG